MGLYLGFSLLSVSLMGLKWAKMAWRSGKTTLATIYWRESRHNSSTASRSYFVNKYCMYIFIALICESVYENTATRADRPMISWWPADLSSSVAAAAAASCGLRSGRLERSGSFGGGAHQDILLIARERVNDTFSSSRMRAGHREKDSIPFNFESLHIVSHPDGQQTETTCDVAQIKCCRRQWGRNLATIFWIYNTSGAFFWLTKQRNYDSYRQIRSRNVADVGLKRHLTRTITISTDNPELDFT